ncbi:hypothetical protein ACF3N7_05270 [Cruoricaptor ignavus]|uniref:hypothetical protein n=1 Tax=Cruoricaptor ignavus TaxID=1118202 RepID=UPI00370D3AE1
MPFLDLSTAQRRMRELRENGELDPVRFCFHTWNQYDQGRLLMGSRKVTLLLGGEPNHGKSQFTNELVMQLIEKHGFKVALFTTESGDVEKVFAHFCGMYQGKSYVKLRPDGKPNQYAMTDAEADEAEYFLLQHLYVFKQDRKDTGYQTLENIYRQLEEAERIYGIKFDSLVIDPIYDVDDFEPKASEVLRVLNRINLEAEENNRFDIIVNHVAETAKLMDKNGNRRKLVALADEFYGGKNNNRKAMLQLLVHRPTPTVDENGRSLPGFEGSDIPVVWPNQTNIHVLKVKPDGIAKWGVYDIYYDWRRRRYYEKYDDEAYHHHQRYADCTKFYDEMPNKNFKPNDFTATPEQAFGKPKEQNIFDDEEYEDMPF